MHKVNTDLVQSECPSRLVSIIADSERSPRMSESVPRAAAAGRPSRASPLAGAHRHDGEKTSFIWTQSPRDSLVDRVKSPRGRGHGHGPRCCTPAAAELELAAKLIIVPVPEISHVGI